MRSFAPSLAALALASASSACAPPQADDVQELGSWQPMTTNGTPAPRVGHVAVWNGGEMIVWGGIHPSDGRRFDDGARYDPALDSWTPMSTAGAPAGRVGHRAVVMQDGQVLVWGGFAEEPSGFVVQATGGRYDPVADSWIPLSTAGAPEARAGHLSVWAGSEMIVWGGQGGAGDPLVSGGR